jgi:membrane fusion protein, multidrug efflux system
LSLNNNEIKKVTVKEGITSQNMTDVFGELPFNDKILKKSSEEIKEGKIK